MKYLHYMPVSSNFYNGETIRMFNINQEFQNDRHDFWLKHNDFTPQNNVTIKPNLKWNELNKIAKNYDYIIFHSWGIPYHIQMIISDQTARKIIWCVWGHDLYKFSNTYIYKNIYERSRKYLIRNLIKYIQTPLIRKINAICYSFPFDKNEIIKLYGNNIKTYHVSYNFPYQIDDIIKLKKRQSSHFNIMIGHSAYEFLNHISVLDNLKRFKNKNIKIFLPMNYGDNTYKKKVVEYCKTYPLEISILDEKLDKEDYLKYLSEMDIVVMDFKHQAAVGNIYLLLLLGKKLFLDGIMLKGLQHEGIEVFPSKEISNMSFEEFVDCNYNADYGKEWVKNIADQTEIIKRWKNLFDECRY